jgi:hypothetical protein
MIKFNYPLVPKGIGMPSSDPHPPHDWNSMAPAERIAISLILDTVRELLKTHPGVIAELVAYVRTGRFDDLSENATAVLGGDAPLLQPNNTPHDLTRLAVSQYVHGEAPNFIIVKPGDIS